MPGLKVYRTPIGLRDDNLPATSQEAALDAWGSGANLFARGGAALIHDPDLTAAPLAISASVIKKAARLAG